MQTNKKNIVLLGMMGAGKTTVAKKLKETLPDFSLVDLDEEIEKSAGITISQIFKLYGEQHFRSLETKCAQNFSNLHAQIISTGGGIVVKEENIEILKQNGITFYLSAPVDELYERVKNTTNRPLLQQDDPKKTIEEILKKREISYQKADFEIETQNKNVDKIVEEIIEKYETKLQLSKS